MKRLTWLVGPPGAGKSTFARRQREWTRSVELTAMLGPLVDEHRIRKGVLTANGQMVAVIRGIELRAENVGLPPLLVVAGLVPEDALFPLCDEEEVLLVLPERARWERQLRARPTLGGSSGQYDDVGYATQWYERFEGWLREGLPVRRVETAFEPGLIGRVP
ncbi:MAG: hypothetical protein Q8S73_11130 [Deltaproteobacteria bacterium]|nr:hypothetical protein [Myxococcales bacterium]MDP3214649.1 hypothetical protein [Deltaproteobacteria bacterium]